MMREKTALFRIRPLQGVLCMLFGISVLTGCLPESQSVERISLDFPYGETRLLVDRQGEARLFYGELPESLAVRDGVFSVDSLYAGLQPRIQKVVPLGQHYGMVTLFLQDGASSEYFIFDRDFTEGLFFTACANLNDEAEKAKTVFDMVCRNRLGLGLPFHRSSS